MNLVAPNTQAAGSKFFSPSSLRLLGVALFALVAARLLAAETADPLTLDDCLKVSATKHPALAAAQAGVAAATEAVGEARAPYYPQVDLSAGYHRWQRRLYLPLGVFPAGIAVPKTIDPLDDWNAGLIARTLLYDFGERRAGLNAAFARRAGAEADATAAQADLRLSVQSAFYALAAAKDLQIVAERNLARTESHLRFAEIRRQAGAVLQADVLRIQAEVANARLQLIGAQSAMRIATGQLNTAMGRAAEAPLDIAAVPPESSPPDAIDLTAAIDRAIANRPELVASAKRVSAARASVEAARAARAPKLRADGAFGWRDNVVLPESQEWQAGLTVDVPLFDQGSRTRRVARLKAEFAREEAVAESHRLQIHQEVWTAMTELERAWAAIGANEASVHASAESLRVVQERYQNGAAVITDLLDTQTALTRAETGLAEARWGYLAARARFERAVGRGVPE